MAKQVRHVRPGARSAADPASRRVIDQIERDFGAFVPPFALHAPAPTLLAASWTMLRESLVPRHVDRTRKEAVASAVSRANACTYCVDAHTVALHALGDAATADALTGAGAPDAALAPLLAWAAATRSADDPLLGTPPFTAAEMPEIVGIALGFHYINRMVTIFLTASPMPFASPRLKSWTRRMLGPIVGPQLQRTLLPGESLAFLPAAPLPPDLAWSAGHVTLATALARAAAAFDAAGAAALPTSVRALVRTQLAEWRGDAPPLDRRWLDDATAKLDSTEHPAARLALLTAFAPERVDDGVIADFRREHADDASLVNATGWASFTTARTIAAWLR